ncbi:hypothetical protein ACFOSC_30610 [Streptantibioticus rubrisoli]|uniref:hypothetical protein n=1 Tax=Streptantibioticus rubrisoli TaxID=1387313 RepID=UPI0027E2F412|nr:hypothetical protein [Streptantibioticus rubrisoli]
MEKQGPLITGWAEIEVSPCRGGSSILWREEIELRRVPRWFAPLSRAVGRLVFGRVVTGLLAEEDPAKA